MKLNEIAEITGGELHGDGNVEIDGVASLEDATAGGIAFLAEARHSDKLASSEAAAFILPKGVLSEDRPFISSDNPFLAFVEVMHLFYPSPPPRGVDARAAIEKSAQIGRDASIFPNAYIGKGAVLGDRVTIYPGACIGADAIIGDDTIIYANVVICDGVEIGDRVIIHGGTVVGSDGFGFVWDGKKHRKIPQVGNVVIGDDVEIGANSTIDRATLSSTIIERGTKIDNLVHIAHNCRVGENSILVGQVGISGSVDIGKNVILAGQAGVADHLNIGDGAIVAARSGVTRNVEAGEKVAGFPILPHMEWLRIQKTLLKLPEMKKQLNELGKKKEKTERSEDEDA